MNLEKYYTYCINKIKEKDEMAKFIICTNEYSENLYNYINNFLLFILSLYALFSVEKLSNAFFTNASCALIASSLTPIDFKYSAIQSHTLIVCLPIVEFSPVLTLYCVRRWHSKDVYAHFHSDQNNYPAQ